MSDRIDFNHLMTWRPKALPIHCYYCLAVPELLQTRIHVMQEITPYA